VNNNPEKKKPVAQATTCIPKHTLALFSFVTYTIQVSTRELMIKQFFHSYSTRGAQTQNVAFVQRPTILVKKPQHFHREMPKTVK
jgi:hypothetical protein